MIGTEERYEISLAIEPKVDLEATARNALTMYLQKLDCAEGAVLKRRGDGNTHDVVGAIPPDSVAEDAFEMSRERIGNESLPLIVPIPLGDKQAYAHVMELPMFGSLVLVKTGDSLDNETLTALEPLNEKLANACHSKQIETQLREERDRFEAVFETIPEPITNVVYEDGEPIIKRVNSAFEDTFGYDEAAAIEKNLSELIHPNAIETRPLDTDDDLDGPVTKEVKRETTDGTGDFLFRSAPVESSTDRAELFGLYVDITAEKNRQRKLEGLSEATQNLLAEPDHEAVCRRAIEAARQVLGFSTTGIYLYERGADALVPVAISDRLRNSFGGDPPVYTDRDRTIWGAYRSDEPVTTDDVQTDDDCPLFGIETAIGSAAVFPLGDHGVFVIADSDSAAFDTTDRYFAGLLSTLVETALDRVVREHGLEHIQETMRVAFGAETHQDVAEAAIDQISEYLDFPFSGVWRYDSHDNALVPVAVTAVSYDMFEEIPSFGPGEGILWDVFQSGESTVIDDVRAHPNVYNENSPLASEIIVPIGDYGVISTGSKLKRNFTQTERNLVEILAANIETALELVDQRQELEVLDQVLARILRHNIRNDLTVIQGHATRITANSDEAIPKAAARTILRKSETLESTAEHAHEMRTVVAQRGKQVHTSLREAAVDAIATVEAAYPTATIETTFEVTPEVVAHPRIETAIEQLVENAVEHGSPTAHSPAQDDASDHGSTGASVARTDGSTGIRETAVEGDGGDTEPDVTVTIRETERGILLEVADNGPGIDPMEIEVLEQHGETALRHGSGAGLWIADRIVDYSDGTLEFDTSDRGTTVTIVFE